MSEQPELLKLLDLLEYEYGPYDGAAAAELRRLHSLNAELMKALRPFAETGLTIPLVQDTFGFNVLRARAALAKAEGQHEPR
jgi:hypothetical protein